MMARFLGLVASLSLAACSGSSEPNDGGSGGNGGSAGGAATGGVGGTKGGTGGASASGGTGGSGAAAGGVGGSGGSDPCAGMPADCVTVCQAGQCQCECGVAPGCPAAAPPEGNPCNSTELCSYGDPRCREIFECDGGAWVSVADTCSDMRAGDCPATQSDALNVACLDRSCGYDGVVCDCLPPSCSGAFIEPFTQCFAPTPAVCQRSISEGGRCFADGQVCGTTCCGRSWTCTDGRWVGQDNPCPP